MKNVIAIFMILGFVNTAIGQATDSFRFSDKSSNMEVEVPEYVGQHYLGQEFTKKFYAVKEQYVYTPEGTATTPYPASVTEKPSIYNSLKKLDKYYKKQLKKGHANEQEVKENLSKVLAVGYSIRYENTTTLEKMLWKTKDITEIEKIFTKKIVLN
ncbi:hypothetical protein FNH22_30500 [Fulvivirga sp. M361]|uniref:hypothetical protein n=1 Tax=Fulvivirga sp. M361 TaxID=2594266 RepID=UPI00117A8697|nr:hypothetical protein [Fulvivirga sp. M361]TRX47152.1 hypothetical protein FNH22_30500 [Fulvivirga sp. M361]